LKVSLATCKTLPEIDPDEVLLVRALEARGAHVRMLPWDAEEAASGELVVLRSTWNYFEGVARFLEWIDRTARTTRLLNPASIVTTNVRKTYLGDLEKRGVPIVPTAFVGAEGGNVEAIVRDRGWSQIVVKPTVSAGSFSTQRFDVSRGCAEAQAFLDGMGREAMVQAWMPDVEGYGERPIVFVEPSLFLLQSEAALERLVSAVVRHARS
jgi:hypothetical protein